MTLDGLLDVGCQTLPTQISQNIPLDDIGKIFIQIPEDVHLLRFIRPDLFTHIVNVEPPNHFKAFFFGPAFYLVQ